MLDASRSSFDAVAAGRKHNELSCYPEAFEASWLARELDQARNFKARLKNGVYKGSLMTGVKQWLLPRIGLKRPPWTLYRSVPDYAMLRPAAECQPIVYPKQDNRLTFDRLTSVFISNTNHEESQPAHLTLKDPGVPVAINLAKYDGPESRYCPAGVCKYAKNTDHTDRPPINAQNCVHCKTYDVKDSTQNIVWVTPKGGGESNYSGMRKSMRRTKLYRSVHVRSIESIAADVAGIEAVKHARPPEGRFTSLPKCDGLCYSIAYVFCFRLSIAICPRAESVERERTYRKTARLHQQRAVFVFWAADLTTI